MQFNVALCVSCRIAMGKLRRTTNIARALRERHHELTLTLLANSAPGGVHLGLKEDEVALFDHIEYLQPPRMAGYLKSIPVDVVVVETMRVPDLQEVNAQLCLILREVLPEELKKFSLKGRPWDLVILPHPDGHWRPDPTLVPARRVESVGWIYRTVQSKKPEDKVSTKREEQRSVLITTGGGSGEDRGNDIRSDIEYVIRELRNIVKFPVKVTQVIGPRDSQRKTIESADDTLRPGPELQNLFPRVDLVISAAGYNSVLELACTDVPVLLVPVPRYTDDQEKRAKFWGEKVGICYDPDQREISIRWIAGVLKNRLRRPPVDLGPSGANRAAALICELQQQQQR